MSKKKKEPSICIVAGFREELEICNYQDKRPPKEYLFDGHALDCFEIESRITNREDMGDLIKFLKVTAYALPFKNGKYTKE